ncbi:MULTISPECIES: MerR family transcriptional regulator [unclassified Brevibacterium]|uniref:MerR family transcriptional regulator n=1 Tax=unclassified Brevibacterium TaxID=2614124 RepID=UPI001F24D431|nr:MULTISPECIES: MerR family transcriptional regulator [unclassified Brevibacterium]MCF2573665.1 MerR family transcriptional regulator [Brevibacterium sp. UCMA 11754]MDN6605174.1 MerR family transcriptional regulator [Brevibacterium sp.]
MTQHTADVSRPSDLRQALSVDPDRVLSISEVSEVLGITAHTARYYERAGLLEVARSHSGHRVYDSATVERLDFLVRMRTSGMGISQLKRYVELVRAGEATTPQRLQIMVDQREHILTQIHELELALTTTDYKIAKYAGTAGDDSTTATIPSRTTASVGDPS